MFLKTYLKKKKIGSQFSGKRCTLIIAFLCQTSINHKKVFDRAFSKVSLIKLKKTYLSTGFYMKELITRREKSFKISIFCQGEV